MEQSVRGGRGGATGQIYRLPACGPLNGGERLCLIFPLSKADEAAASSSDWFAKRGYWDTVLRLPNFVKNMPEVTTKAASRPGSCRTSEKCP